MKTIYMVIANCGDGSNSIDWVLDKEVIDRMEELADEGDERYSSGDGLQVNKVKFPDDFDVEAWVKLNFYGATTLADLE